MGFAQTMNAIIANLPQKRQTLLFSATQTKSVKDLARLSLKDPCYVSVHDNCKYTTPAGLEQSYMVCELKDKIAVIWSFIRNHLKKKTIIFLSSCKQVKFVYEIFCKLQPGTSILALYGSLHQQRRIATYESFSEKKSAVLIATDLASRGLDFPEVHWVVHADCPEDTDTYIHRVGRTARYFRGGESVLLLLPSEVAMVEKLKDRKIPLTKIEVNPTKLQNPVKKMEALLVKFVSLKESAQRAFKNYIKYVYLMKDKTVFDVHSLDMDSFARSLGLAVTPRVRFLQRLNAKVQHSEKSVVKNVISNVSHGTDEDISGFEENYDRTQPEVDSDSDEDILTIKRRDHDIDLPSQELEEPYIKQSKKVVTKVALAKKILRKNIAPNKKIIFNDDGEAVSHGNKEKRSELAQAYENDIDGGLDIEKAKLVLREEDKYDKQLFKARIKLKHKEQKKKLKEKELKEKESKEQEQDYFGSESEAEEQDLSWLPDPDKIYGQKSDSELKEFFDEYEQQNTLEKPKMKRKQTSLKSQPSSSKKKKKAMKEASSLSVNEAEELAMLLLQNKS